MNVLTKEKPQGQNGFTIIEVVLVLAIAGLIFLMVFIALPALQSSQRDTARKNDVSAVASAITTFGSNNRGAFPTTTALTGNGTGTPDATSGKFTGYITTVSSNIDTVTIQTAGSTSANVTQGQIIVTQKTQCGATAAASQVGGAKSAKQLLTTGSTRQFTVTTYLEAGGGTSYCQDS